MTSFKNLDIIFEDQLLIAINKPSGLLTIPDRYDDSKENLYEILKLHFGSIFTVHRLDKETSGTIIFAKTAEAHKALNTAFEERRTNKRYLAVVNGAPREQNGIIDLSIDEHPSGKGKMMPSKKGKESVTEFSVIEHFSNFALIEAHPLTGRTHQIRVHFAAIGHPLAVDSIYGTRSQLLLSEIKKGYRGRKDEPERPLISRLTLHSWKLTFDHPQSGQPVSVESPIPKDIHALLSQLRKKKLR
jgi:23S rRNA pseudouridine955/2504/2580 synthase/23S rRNA pseudouridine1911/1915/1917 synthase